MRRSKLQSRECKNEKIKRNERPKRNTCNVFVNTDRCSILIKWIIEFLNWNLYDWFIWNPCTKKSKLCNYTFVPSVKPLLDKHWQLIFFIYSLLTILKCSVSCMPYNINFFGLMFGLRGWSEFRVNDGINDSCTYMILLFKLCTRISLGRTCHRTKVF